MDSDALQQVLIEAQRRGFLGPGPIEGHLRSAQRFAEALPTAELNRELSLLDLGSGGGVPALPLVVWRSDIRATLVDARSKRTRFLSESIRHTTIESRVQVRTGRVEELETVLQMSDIVTARSFGPPSATVELASLLLNPNGLALVSEPPGGRTWAAEGLEALGLVQVSAAGAPIAAFRKRGLSPPRRRWKHLIERPTVSVALRSP